MPHDTINKAVTIARVAAIGFTLWKEIKTLANEIAQLNPYEELNAFMDELDELDPNSLRGLAWQTIKTWANDPANEWLEHM